METDSQRTMLLLIRHGQSYYNRDGAEAGTDSELTPLGWAQARALAEWLSDHERIDALYSSRMVRAQQTASEIGSRLGMGPVVQVGLQEAEEMYWHELPSMQGPDDIWPSSAWQPTPGESPLYSEFVERVSSAVSGIVRSHTGQRIAIVGHGGAWASLLRTLVGGHRVLVATDNCAMHKLVYSHDRWMIRYLNRVLYTQYAPESPQ